MASRLLGMRQFWRTSLGASALVLLAFATACSKPEPVLQIGTSTITDVDIELRLKEQRLENATAEIGPEIALMQLFQAYAGAEIFKKYGRPLTDEIIENEAKRIENTTLMPNKLKQLQDAFPSRAAWLRLYVVPVYVSRELYYGFFMRDPRFHQEAYSKLNRIVEEKKKESFAASAKKAQLAVKRLEISDSSQTAPSITTDPNVPPHIAQAALGNGTAQSQTHRLIEEVLSKMRIGQLTPIIEEADRLVLMRLISVRAGKYTVEAVSAPKAQYQPWFGRELSELGARCLTEGRLKKACRDVLARLARP